MIHRPSVGDILWRPAVARKVNAVEVPLEGGHVGAFDIAEVARVVEVKHFLLLLQTLDAVSSVITNVH